MAGRRDIPKEFIVNLQGKDFVTYEGLLNLAHQDGLTGIEVEILQLPTTENNMTAICMATATTDKSVYKDIGDASPTSVSKMLVPHILRMASTRAKARALRDLTNVGMTALEEMTAVEEKGQGKTKSKNNGSKSTGKNITPEQIAFAIDLMKKSSKENKFIVDHLKSKYGAAKVQELTSQQASELIKQLQEWK